MFSETSTVVVALVALDHVLRWSLTLDKEETLRHYEAQPVSAFLLASLPEVAAESSEGSAHFGPGNSGRLESAEVIWSA